MRRLQNACARGASSDLADPGTARARPSWHGCSGAGRRGTRSWEAWRRRGRDQAAISGRLRPRAGLGLRRATRPSTSDAPLRASSIDGKTSTERLSRRQRRRGAEEAGGAAVRRGDLPAGKVHVDARLLALPGGGPEAACGGAMAAATPELRRSCWRRRYHERRRSHGSGSVPTGNNNFVGGGDLMTSGDRMCCGGSHGRKRSYGRRCFPRRQSPARRSTTGAAGPALACMVALRRSGWGR